MFCDWEFLDTRKDIMPTLHFTVGMVLFYLLKKKKRYSPRNFESKHAFYRIQSFVFLICSVNR